MNEQQENNTELKQEILKTFLVQFAENQNHLQKLFMQFFIAITVVVAGYGYVAMGITPDSHILQLKDNSIYPVSYLIVAFIINQAVLVSLNSFVGCNAYNFRRDQGVVYKIRKKILDKEYSEFFDERSFNPYNKIMAFWDISKPFKTNKRDVYMPTFYVLFWQFIVCIQIIISGIFSAQMLFVVQCASWIKFLCIILVALFLFLSIFWRRYYFKKYENKVNKKQS